MTHPKLAVHVTTHEMSTVTLFFAPENVTWSTRKPSLIGKTRSCPRILRSLMLYGRCKNDEGKGQAMERMTILSAPLIMAVSLLRAMVYLVSRPFIYRSIEETVTISGWIL